MACRARFVGVESTRVENEADLLARARRGAGRVLDELERGGKDLASPWPRVAPGVIAEGKSAVENMAAALRKVAALLDEPSEPDQRSPR